MKDETLIFKALADETRLRILALLLGGELCVCEIIAALELPQSTVSRHLAYLRHSGWVRDRRQGIWMYYRLNDREQDFVGELKPVLEKRLKADPAYGLALARLQAFRQEQNLKAC